MGSLIKIRSFTRRRQNTLPSIPCRAQNGYGIKPLLQKLAVGFGTNA